MICENCGIEHNGDYGSGRFCCSKCARGFSTKNRRLEINGKISKSLIGNQNTKGKKQTKEHIQKRLNSISPETRKKSVEKNNKRIEEKYISTPFDLLSYRYKKRRVLEEQKGKCNRCGIDEWLGQKITLELEHKDGNCSNNERENLECLCPNCHSMTSTWKVGHQKRKGGRLVSVEDNVLLDALRRNKSIRSALIAVGLTAKGGNYNRCYELLKNDLGV